MTGMKIMFDVGEAKIYRSSKLITVGYSKGAIYELTFELQNKHEVKAFHGVSSFL